MIRATIFVTLCIIAVYGQDMSTSPTQFTGSTGIVSWYELGITNEASVALTSVAFKVVNDQLTTGYQNGGSQATVGTINTGATGYGTFSLSADTGIYNLSILVTYKKSGINKTFNTTALFSVGQSGGGNGKRFESVYQTDDADAEAEAKEVASRSDISARDNYLNINTDYVFASAGVGTWDGIYFSTGSIQCLNVSYTVVSMDGQVLIAYPYAGNYIGTVGTNTTAQGNFEHVSDCGYYNLNVTITYRLAGTNTYRKVWKVILCSVSGGSCESGDSDSKRYAEEIALDDEVNVESAASKLNSIYAIAIGIVGIAFVAVFGVVGTAIFIRRQRTETVVA